MSDTSFYQENSGIPVTTAAILPVSPITPTVVHGLTRTPHGEYTAESVNANPALATGLVKLKDGNYSAPIVASASLHTGLAADLTALKLGGE